jgi:TM2 domain-containing membrane protein YozV
MEKSKIVAALLAFFLGFIGIHKFYLGKTKAGVIHIVLGIGGYVLLFIGMASAFAGAMAGSGGIGGLGVLLLIIGLLAVAVNGVICLIETIIYLTKSDEDFNRIYVAGDKAWF